MIVPKPGDWIRFNAGGRLVLGEVAYVIFHERQYPYRQVAHTIEHGAVDSEYILEVRSRKEPTHD